MPELWKVLDLPGEPKKSMCSPFREDANESFSVFQKDGLWFYKDHANGEKGDEVSLIKRVKNFDDAFAIAWYHDVARVEKPAWGPTEAKQRQARQSGAIPRHFGKGTPPPEDEARDVSRGDAEDAAGEAPAAPKAKKAKKKPGKMVAFYDYHDPDGRLAHQTVRFEPKGFSQRRPARPNEEAREGWVWSLEGIQTYLYRLPMVMGADASKPIFFVEGEKDADNLAKLGLIATTVPMGAGKWREEYREMLEGKWVVVVGDNDEPGEKHVKNVLKELQVGPARLGSIHLGEKWAGCPPKGDVSDWIDAQEDGMDILAGTLLQWAYDAPDPREFLGCVVMGARGPKLIPYTCAKAMVKRYGVVYAGAQWWRWIPLGGDDPDRGGVWFKDKEQLRIKCEIAERLVDLPGALELVTDDTVSGIARLMASMTAMHPDDFNDHDRALINCRNGMLNVETRELLPHAPEMFSTVQIPWKYNPKATCPEWEKWLEERLPDAEVRGLIQEMYGYCLAGERINYHRFFFLFGDGGTGKSTVVDILTRLVGAENMVALQLQELDNSFTRSTMVGKRLYLAKELTRDSLKHIGLIKAITSGDPIFVEQKRKDGYSYVPKGRFVMESNIRAFTPDSSDGFSRRILQVTFRNKLRRDEMDFERPEKLAKEMEGIFFWALEGLTRLMKRGHFEETQDSRKAEQELQMHRASVKAFFDQCVQLVDIEERWQSVTALFTTYKAWCTWCGVKPHYDDAAPFSRELLNRIPELKARQVRRRIGGDRLMCYTGIEFTKWEAELGVKEFDEAGQEVPI